MKWPGYQGNLRAGFDACIAGSRRPGCWRQIAVLRSEQPRRITSLWIWHPQRCPPGGRFAVRWDVGSACASPTINIRRNSESCAHPRRSRRTGLLNKAGRPAEKRRGRLGSRARALTRAQTENFHARQQRGGIHRKPMAMLRKTQRVAAGARRAMLLTTGELDSVVGRFGSPICPLSNGFSVSQAVDYTQAILPTCTYSQGNSFSSRPLHGSGGQCVPPAASLNKSRT